MTSDLSCSPLHVQDGRTALFIACKEGHDQIVELLLKKEANVNHQKEVRPLMLVGVFLHEEWLPSLMSRTHDSVTCIAMNKVIIM